MNRFWFEFTDREGKALFALPPLSRKFWKTKFSKRNRKMVNGKLYIELSQDDAHLVNEITKRYWGNK